MPAIGWWCGAQPIQGPGHGKGGFILKLLCITHGESLPVTIAVVGLSVLPTWWLSIMFVLWGLMATNLGVVNSLPFGMESIRKPEDGSLTPPC